MTHVCLRTKRWYMKAFMRDGVKLPFNASFEDICAAWAPTAAMFIPGK